MTQLKLNLYDNAIDSIRHAIEHYTNDPIQTRRYKYTILHFAQGVLLLLKDRLSKEHPNFIYKNVSDNDSATVDTNMLFSRLKKIAGLELSEDEQTIKELINLRNNIEHYEVELQQASVDSLIGRLIPFLIEFCQEELGKNFENEVGKETWKALQNIQDYRQYAILEAKKRILGSGKTPSYCSYCQDFTAIEQIFPVNLSSQTVPGRTGYKIICQACLQTMELGHKCQECKANVPHTKPEPFLYPGDSYCPKCKDEAKREFPGFENSMYVAEVRRWFESNEKINVRQLMDLVPNVAMHGPTGVVRYPWPLIQKGVISFSDDYYRDRNEKMKEALKQTAGNEYHHFFQMGLGDLHGDETFIWTWDKRQENEP